MRFEKNQRKTISSSFTNCLLFAVPCCLFLFAVPCSLFPVRFFALLILKADVQGVQGTSTSTKGIPFYTTHINKMYNLCFQQLLSVVLYAGTLFLNDNLLLLVIVWTYTSKWIVHGGWHPSSMVNLRQILIAFIFYPSCILLGLQHWY